MIYGLNLLTAMQALIFLTICVLGYQIQATLGKSLTNYPGPWEQCFEGNKCAVDSHCGIGGDCKVDCHMNVCQEVG